MSTVLPSLIKSFLFLCRGKHTHGVEKIVKEGRGFKVHCTSFAIKVFSFSFVRESTSLPEKMFRFLSDSSMEENKTDYW